MPIHLWIHLASLEPLKDDPVHDFHLTIRLEMADQLKLVSNLKFDIKISECLVIEFLAIISDDGVEKSKLIDD